jgi:hypothetical protein
MTFGGFAQFSVNWLIQATGSPIAPVFYVMFGAVMGLLAELVNHTRESRLPIVKTVTHILRRDEVADAT